MSVHLYTTQSSGIKASEYSKKTIHSNENMGSGALSGKMLLVRIIVNDKIELILGNIRLIKG